MKPIRSKANRGHKPFVYVFIPYCRKHGRAESPDYDTPATREELTRAFDHLSLPWKWQPITFENLESVIREMESKKPFQESLALNFCDGDEINGFPGLSVVRKLEEAAIPFTGADTPYYQTTTSKILMKEKFNRSGVATPPYRVINEKENGVAGLCGRLGIPLIVKPAISAASWGITLKSIVHTDEEIGKQVEGLLKGRHGCVFLEGTIFVEKFINGPEFTALLVGSSRKAEKIKVYPPVERVFNNELPLIERLLSFERYWGVYDEEPPLPSGTTLYTYRLVGDETLKKRIEDLCRRAYLSVGGCGYGRVDIRMDLETGELYVLEVNANCGISSDNQTSVGQILRLSGGSFSHLLGEILDEALRRQDEGEVDRQ